MMPPPCYPEAEAVEVIIEENILILLQIPIQI